MIILTIIVIQTPYSLRTISDLEKACSTTKMATWERLIGIIRLPLIGKITGIMSKYQASARQLASAGSIPARRPIYGYSCIFPNCSCMVRWNKWTKIYTGNFHSQNPTALKVEVCILVKICQCMEFAYYMNLCQTFWIK